MKTMNIRDLAPKTGNSSLKKMHWEVLEADNRAVLYLCQQIKIHEVLARVLVNRGLREAEEVENFLQPKLRNLLPDPFILQDMDKAVRRIIEALQKEEKITIFADYDVDGATSAALLYKFLLSCGSRAEIYIPDRLTEGYGPSVPAVTALKKNGTALMITVDCGTAAFESLKAAKELGLDVIVLDHHLAGATLPEVYALVNPNRVDDDFPYKEIAAVAVTFLTIIALRAKLREFKWFEGKAEPDLMKYLDLVALGTVCDVMPLTGLNRAFVAHGLSLMAKRQNLGLRILSDIAKLDSKPRSFHLSYILGPRINAGGRVSKGGLGAALLITEDAEEAYQLAHQLDAFNNERKALEQQALEEIMVQIEANNYNDQPIIFAVGENWHIGILGILASRVKDKYNKPAFVISSTDAIGKGSARSIAGVNLGAIISAAKAAGLLLEGGGHAMAGGLTLATEQIDAFKLYASAQVNRIAELEGLLSQASVLTIDAVLTIGAINHKLVETIAKAEPFGQHNHQPRFMVRDVRIIRAMPFGQSHLSLIVEDALNTKTSKTLKCVLFKALETEFGQLLLQARGRLANIVGTLHLDEWEKDRIKLIVEDVALHA